MDGIVSGPLKKTFLQETAEIKMVVNVPKHNNGLQISYTSHCDGRNVIALNIDHYVV